MSAINSINPYIRVALYSILPKSFVIKQRIIFDYELIYIEKGELLFNYCGVDYNCKQGQFVFIRPNLPHSFINTDSDLYQPHIHFDMIYNMNSEITPISFKDVTELNEREKKLITKDLFKKYPKTPFVVFSDNKRALELFYNIVNAPNNAQGLKYKAMLTELIFMLISDNFPDVFSNENSKNYTIFHQIKDYIDSEQGLDMSLEDFEKQFSYSKFYIERQFKKQFGISLIEYRNKKRMQKAAELIMENSVTKVSELLGFSSVYSFSRTFKNEFGVSPLNYKNQDESLN